MRGLSSLQVADWIQITERSTSILLGRWSPDGNLLYYPSRDGRIRAQRLDPKTKHPVGTPIEIYRLPEDQIGPSSRITMQGMSVAAHQIVFPLLEKQIDIWMMEPHAQR